MLTRKIIKQLESIEFKPNNIEEVENFINSASTHALLKFRNNPEIQLGDFLIKEDDLLLRVSPKDFAKSYRIISDDSTEQRFFLCDCHSDGILVTKFVDEDDRSDSEVYLSMFSQTEVNDSPSIWSRIKYALWHIKTGKKYKDQVIFSYEKTKELGEYLIKISQ